jgi:hypothetical protein
MNPPRASNQVSLYRENKWVGGAASQAPTIGEVFRVMQAVFVVDEAIKRMMEQNNGL